MDTLTLALLAVVSLAAAVYAHFRLKYLTASRAQANVARAVLLLTSLAFGFVALKQIGSGQSDIMQMLIFIAAWGMVHVPAAIILFLKQLQRARPRH